MADNDTRHDGAAPLSAAELVAWDNIRAVAIPPMVNGDMVARMLATIAARDAELATCQRDYALLRDEVASPEITRLESENAALREIVAAVANGSRYVVATAQAPSGMVVGSSVLVCVSDETVARARALLATSTSPAMVSAPDVMPDEVALRRLAREEGALSRAERAYFDEQSDTLFSELHAKHERRKGQGNLPVPHDEQPAE